MGNKYQFIRTQRSFRIQSHRDCNQMTGSIIPGNNRAFEGAMSMLRYVWKVRVLLAIAALMLVAGGAVAFAASGGAPKGGTPAASSGAAHSVEGQSETSEPTKNSTEPPAHSQVNKPGRITSVDCAGGTITINVDGNDGAFTAQLTSKTEININGHPGTCSGLKLNWHVTMKAQQLNGQWVAQSVSQDDSSPNSGGGDPHTPTPAPSH